MNGAVVAALALASQEKHYSGGGSMPDKPRKPKGWKKTLKNFFLGVCAFFGIFLLILLVASFILSPSIVWFIFRGRFYPGADAPWYIPVEFLGTIFLDVALLFGVISAYIGED